jgi:transcriptional regulator with GAF, ATPase, and Fis domain
VEEHVVEHLGGSATIRVDARIIAATNRNLETAVAAGEFRQDLYYRLAVLPIRIPPLRERGDDVLLLASDFLDRFAASCASRACNFLSTRWPPYAPTAAWQCPRTAEHRRARRHS